MTLAQPVSKGLSGFTMSPFWTIHYRDWLEEVKFRRESLQDATAAGDDTSGLNQPRTWSAFTTNPDDNPSSADSLRNQGWWNERTRPGFDSEYVGAWLEHTRATEGDWGYFKERALMTPWVRTTMADYIPDMFNVWESQDGTRIRSTDLTKDWAADTQDGGAAVATRAGWNILQGVSGFGMGALGIIAIGAALGLFGYFKGPEGIGQLAEVPGQVIKGFKRGITDAPNEIFDDDE